MIQGQYTLRGLSWRRQRGLLAQSPKGKQPVLRTSYCCCEVTSVVSDSVRPQRRQPTRLPRPWDSPGKNTGVGCHFLLHMLQLCNLLSLELKVHRSSMYYFFFQLPVGLQLVMKSFKEQLIFILYMCCLNSFNQNPHKNSLTGVLSQLTQHLRKLRNMSQWLIEESLESNNLDSIQLHNHLLAI